MSLPCLRGSMRSTMSSRSLYLCWMALFAKGATVCAWMRRYLLPALYLICHLVDVRAKAIRTAIAMVSGAYKTSLVSYFAHRDLFPSLMKVRTPCLPSLANTNSNSLFMILIPRFKCLNRLSFLGCWRTITNSNSKIHINCDSTILSTSRASKKLSRVSALRALPYETAM